MTMRKTIARTIWNEMGEHGPPLDDRAFEVYRDMYEDIAEAVLKVMREPSMWMCMAHGAKEWDDWSAYDLWQAMIDRAAAPSIEDDLRSGLQVQETSETGQKRNMVQK